MQRSEGCRKWRRKKKVAVDVRKKYIWEALKKKKERQKERKEKSKKERTRTYGGGIDGGVEKLLEMLGTFPPEEQQ